MSENQENPVEVGPDNNKRLALLDERMPALVEAVGTLTAAVAPDLEVAKLNEGEADIDWVVRLLGEASNMAGDVVAERDALMKELSQVSTDVINAKEKIATLEAAATKAKNAPKVKSSEAKGRKVGPLPKGAGNPPLEELLADIREADTVELAFSDGKSEIAGLPAQVVEGDVWKIAPGGLVLDLAELIVQAPLDTSLQLQGYGLVLDGKQVAWSPRGDGQLTLGSGTRFNLAPDVLFRAAE